MNHNRVTISLSLKAWMSLLGLGLTIYALRSFTPALLLIVEIGAISLLFSLIIGPLADYFTKRRVKRGCAVLGMYLIGFFLIIGVLVLLLPLLATDIASLLNNLPSYISQLQAQLTSLPVIGTQLASVLSNTASATADLGAALEKAASELLAAFGDLSVLTIELVTVLTLTFFFSTNPTARNKLIYGWMSPRRMVFSEGVVRRLEGRLPRWLLGQLGVSLYIFLAQGTLLWLLGIPNAFSISLVAGVLEFIPYLGGFVGGVLAALGGLTISPLTALLGILATMLVSGVESYVIDPLFFGKAVTIHPALVLVGLLLFGIAAGLLGVFLAIPLMVVISEIYNSLVLEHRERLAAQTDGANGEVPSPPPIEAEPAAADQP